MNYIAASREVSEKSPSFPLYKRGARRDLSFASIANE
jgi:hypothetical protein